MQQAEIFELFRPILQQTAGRRRITDYVTALILALLIAGWGYYSWRNAQVPKINSIDLVPNSVVIIGPEQSVNASGVMEFCPGDLFTVRYQLAIEGDGVIYADDAAHLGNQTVKFSTVWRDYARDSTRTYENEWVIPRQPEMAINGQRRWANDVYTRVISVAASNIYISRYVPPATFEVSFRMKEESKCRLN